MTIHFDFQDFQAGQAHYGSPDTGADAEMQLQRACTADAGGHHGNADIQVRRVKYVTPLFTLLCNQLLSVGQPSSPSPWLCNIMKINLINLIMQWSCVCW